MRLSSLETITDRDQEWVCLRKFIPSEVRVVTIGMMAVMGGGGRERLGGGEGEKGGWDGRRGEGGADRGVRGGKYSGRRAWSMSGWTSLLGLLILLIPTSVQAVELDPQDKVFPLFI